MVKRMFSISLLVSLALATAAAAVDDELEVVEPAFVCMVSDAAYSKEQVPVEVDGKTYYGCCEMCKARLERNQDLRTGTDPVSGRQVDKAKAVIAKDSYERVFYFENEENLKKFNAKRKSK